MKFLYLFAAVLFIAAPGRAQNAKAPDYTAIESETADKTSQYYYPGLRERYDRRDSTLTFQDFKHLYYGSFFQPEFQLHYPRQDELDALKRKETLTEEDYRKVIALSGPALKENPFDLNLIAFRIYVFRQLNELSAAMRERMCYRGILDVIFSTGDGTTCETGYHVASISDEYLVMSVSKLKVESQALVGHCDYLKAWDNDDHVAGLYFDITKILQKESEIFGGAGPSKKGKKDKKKNKKGEE